ncbi:MAG: nitroreductase/quinone reductase family protein [Nocardioidaceae bacterium]
MNKLMGSRNGPDWTLTLHQRLYRGTDGRLGHGLIGLPTLLLTVPGRRTGIPRTVGLVYAGDGNTFAVSSGATATADKQPAWVGNVRAHPEVALQVWRDHLTCRARVLDPSDPEYASQWARIVALNPGRFNGYRASAGQPLPVVVLDPC